MPRSGRVSLSDNLYIDPESGTLYVSGERLKMRLQLERVLKVLYAAMKSDPEEYIPSSALRDRAWPRDKRHKAINEENVYASIYALRKFLGTSEKTRPIEIEGERKRGYRMRYKQIESQSDPGVDGVRAATEDPEKFPVSIVRANEAVVLSAGISKGKERDWRRVKGYTNPRSLDYEGFVERLGLGPKGFVTIGFPTNRPNPTDDFLFRLLKGLKEAGWQVHPYPARSYDNVSGFGITLGAVPDAEGKFPEHLMTLRYALERSGVPVQVCELPPNRKEEGVSLIVGAETP